jgi:hypothetical protein
MTTILKQTDLEKKRDLFSLRLQKARIDEYSQEKKAEKHQKLFNEIHHRNWELSEKIAGLNGLISQCKEGKVEVYDGK